jgi:predicted transglutaminase-like cysteine proteinase
MHRIRSSLKPARALSLVGLYGLLLAGAMAAPAELGFSRSVTPGLITHYAGRFGSGVRGRLEGWNGFVRGEAGRSGQSRASEAGLLGPVNDFFNRVPSVEDRLVWGVEDYWATPSETLSVNGADCEDYAIAKYFTLKELGIPVARLRFVYARTWWSRDSAHLVLAYYPTPGAEPLILDNLQGGIEPASNRPDLTPVFTFNDEDLMMAQGAFVAVRMNPLSNRRWKEVVEKLELELKF